MLKFTRIHSLLVLLFFIYSTPSFGQYSIEKRDNKFVLLKKGKVQKNEVTNIDYFKDCYQPIEVYRVGSKKKDGIAFKTEASSTWQIEWFDKIILPTDPGETYSLSTNGLVHVKIGGKHGLYSCVLGDYFISANYQSISMYDKEMAFLKIEKDNLYGLVNGGRIYGESIENELVFAEEITPFYDFFIYKTKGKSNVYIVTHDEEGSEGKHHYVKQLDEDLQAVYEWPIAKRNGKFGLLRLSANENIPKESRFYNTAFDTLYFANDPKVEVSYSRTRGPLVGIKDGGYYYFVESIKDSEGIHYSSQSIAINGGTNLTEAKRNEIMPHLDLMFGYWQVNEKPYDNIYFENGMLCAQQGELYGLVMPPSLYPPTSEINEVHCKSKLSDPQAMIGTDPSSVVNDEVQSYELFAKDEYGRRLFLLYYDGHGRIAATVESDTLDLKASFTSISAMQNNNFIIENDGFLTLINYNKEYLYESAYRDLLNQLENAVWLNRVYPPKSYFQGYEILDLKLPKKTIQVMMDVRGVEYVVSKAFLTKYPDKYDMMEFLSFEVKLSDYLKTNK